MGEFAQVLRGTPNDNHWVKVHLEGTVSNRDGTGAKIILHPTTGPAQLRTTYAGENYLGQNSRWESFGLGETASILSVEVHWPSGTVTSHSDLAVDAHWALKEDGTAVQLWEQTVDPCETGDPALDARMKKRVIILQQRPWTTARARLAATPVWRRVDRERFGTMPSKCALQIPRVRTISTTAVR